MIFINTVFMNNFSISKKLCTTDAATCHADPRDFRFEFGKIFSRKPLKKIKRNVISKLARLLVTKAVMKYQWPDIDDIVFIFILLFHQLSFLYYVQMNSQTNYLRFCSESVPFMFSQKIIKKYSKGLSLLVKVNNSVMTGGYTFSLKIFQFLFRMWLSHFIKSIIIMRATKSREKFNRTKLAEVLKYQLTKVVVPTFVLYVSVIYIQAKVCHDQQFKVLAVFGSLHLDCSWLEWLAEKLYIFYFIYTDYVMKSSKWRQGQVSKQKNPKIGKDDIGESSNELMVRTKCKSIGNAAHHEVFSQSENDE